MRWHLRSGSAPPTRTIVQRRPALHRLPPSSRWSCSCQLSVTPALPERVDVAIVGGGPCGLATAHALLQVLPHGAKVAVFDKGPAATAGPPRGAGLALEVNGLKALRAISPAVYHAVMNTYATTVHTTEIRDPSGAVVRVSESLAMLQATKAKYGEHVVYLGWQELVTALAELLPANCQVHSFTKLLKYDETEAGLKLCFSTRGDKAGNDSLSGASGSNGDSSSSKEQEAVVTAGLLVAADGYFSSIRQQCLHDGPPDFGGTLIWRARLEVEQAARFGFQLHKSVFYFGGNRVIFIYPAGHGHVVWTASCPEADLEQAGISWQAVADARRDAVAQSTDYLQRTEANGLAAKERLLRMFAGFDPEILDLFASTAPSAIVEHPLYIRPAQELRPECFGRARVVIVGDAAHPMRPTGQGTNQAFEDALMLARCIKQDNGEFKQLDNFRRRRAARLQPIMMSVEMQGKSAYRRSSLAAVATISGSNPASRGAGGIHGKQRDTDNSGASSSDSVSSKDSSQVPVSGLELPGGYEHYVFAQEDFSPLVPAITCQPCRS